MSLTPKTFTIAEVLESEQYLQDYGYVCYREILTQSETCRYDNLLRDLLTKLNPNIHLSDHTTWTNKEMPGDYSTGIVTHYGVPQSDFAWYLRTHPQTQQAFANLYKIHRDELCTSLDGINLQFNYRNHKRNWLHRDQVPWVEGGNLPSYQGIYSRYPSGDQDGGFICVPNSHNSEIPYNPKIKTHWAKIAESDPVQDEAKKINVPENSLLIFSSRLLHSNTSGTRNHTDRLNRVANYLSFWPKSGRSERVLQKKQQIYRDGAGTSHWAIYARRTPVKPRWPRSNKSTPLPHLLPGLTNGRDIPAARLALL
jgi:hypothetical protein